MTEYILGIDLGTTNSCVAVMMGGEVKVLPNDEGSYTTPSVVHIDEQSQIIVGAKAKRLGIMKPKNTFFSVKRLIGRKYESPEIKQFIDVNGFKIVEAQNGDAWIMVNGEAVSPQEISAHLLSYLKKCAADAIGQEVNKAVITVPAHFNDIQRQATKDAGEIAGLEVLRLINEPTSASMAFGFHSGKDLEGNVAVYDIGGGTFDISVLSVEDGAYQVKSTDGNTFLGGDDFDRVILNYITEEFKSESSVDLSADKNSMVRVVEAAERTKRDLSSMEMGEINIPFIANSEEGPVHLIQQLSRSRFENLSESLIQESLKCCKDALEKSGLEDNEIDSILLVGGMSRMPKIEASVQEFFSKKVNKTVNPDHAVAIGAAIQGGILSGQKDDIILLDVTSLSIGVETAGGVFTKLIERNTTIPTRRKKVFSTARDNQDFVRVHILQGENELAENNQSLAVFELQGIPPAPRGVPQIELSLSVDRDGILRVSAQDLGTKQEKEVKVEPSSGLSKKDIEKALANAEKLKDAEKDKVKLIKLSNEADELVYTCENSLDLYKSILDEGQIKHIEDSMENLKAALKSRNLEKIESSYNHLRSLVHAASSKMYEN